VLLRRLRIAEHDPAWALAARAGEMPRARLDDAARGSLVSRVERVAPHARSARDSRTAADWRIHRDAAPAEFWLAACRRLLRRRVRLGLASLVRRPARLALTPTHVDVFFAPDAADLRVRRAGLDLDPGWVPWLARVVAFHYRQEPR
jgi:hypothetical protein